MKHNIPIKCMRFILTLTLITGILISTVPLRVNASAGKAMNIGSDVLANPTAGGKEGNWEGCKVYFGLNVGKNKWRVLDASTGLLFADRPVVGMRYDDDSNNWESSEVNVWLNGSNYKSNTDCFSKLEQAAMSSDMTLLTVEDATNEAYGFEKDIVSKTRKAACWWWLRTTTTNEQFVASVHNYGYLHSDGTYVALMPEPFQRNVRPAFCIDLSSILFTTVSGVKKPIVSPYLQRVEEASSNLWILTLFDPSKGIVIESAEEKDGTITVEYSDAKGEYLSIVVTQENEILYYGKVAKISEKSGSASFRLPTGVSLQQVKAFIESDKGINQTKYASKPIDIFSDSSY